LLLFIILNDFSHYSPNTIDPKFKIPLGTCSSFIAISGLTPFPKIIINNNH
jgi:hypothetical protein